MYFNLRLISRCLLSCGFRCIYSVEKEGEGEGEKRWRARERKGERGREREGGREGEGERGADVYPYDTDFHNDQLCHQYR